MNARAEGALSRDAPPPASALASQDIDVPALRERFDRQDRFIALDRFLAPAVAARLADSANALMPHVNRNYLPGHKKGGSVSRYTIDEHAPWIAELYRSREMIATLERLCGESLQPCPGNDPHAYALYYYTEPGDHIGWHYDTSYYDGRRYTLLLGVLDRSSCRLEYELHTRDDATPTRSGSVRLEPGGLAFFDGDRLRHRITPSGHDETRVSLTFEYVTDPGMRPWWRLVSNLKDAFAYFGFRQLLRGRSQRRMQGDA